MGTLSCLALKAARVGISHLCGLQSLLKVVDLPRYSRGYDCDVLG